MEKKHIKIAIDGFVVSKSLTNVIWQELQDLKQSDWKTVVLNFRDPSYSIEKGGFHPVEISIDNDGTINYITDFSYSYGELSKEIDFDFSCREFQMFGNAMPISEGRSLFKLWQGNFCEYYKMGVFVVSKELI
jgi:Protein of unknown function (DUF2787)